MTYYIDIPKEYLNELKDSYFESEAYKDILAEIAIRDRACENKTLENLTALYKNSLIRYTKAKADLELDFIRKNYPTVVSWTAHFGDDKLTIETND